MVRKTTLIGVLVAASVALGGCVLPNQFKDLQTDVTDMQRKLQQLERQQADSTDRLERLALDLAEREQAGISREEFADLRLTLDDIQRQQGMVGEQLGEANRRMDGLSQAVQENRQRLRQMGPMASTTPSLPTDPASGGGADPGSTGSRARPSADDLYNAAYADFSKGNYALAISGFEEYASRYPESDRADNALYWVGECYFSQGDYRVAVQAMNRMLERYPESDRAAAANLKKGLSFMERNQIREAIVQLRFVRDRYGGTDEARIATDKLTSLGAL